MANQAMQRTNGGGRGSLKQYLEDPSVKAKLGEVATANMRADDLVRLALMAASRQPEIAKCSQHSILRALMDAAALGIKPGGLMGRGYLVPRKNRSTNELEACFDPGWRGLVDIARRSGQIKRIEAHVVYEGDDFEMVRSPFTSIRHIPSEEGDPGPIRAAYAIAEFSDGATQIEVLWRRDLDKIRKSSASQGGPWSTWYDEMARKSAVRRLCKYLPYDPLLERALEAATDAEADEPIGRDMPSVSLEQKPPQTRRLAAKISSRKSGSSPDVAKASAEAGSVADQGAPPVDDDANDEDPDSDEIDRGDDPSAY